MSNPKGINQYSKGRLPKVGAPIFHKKTGQKIDEVEKAVSRHFGSSVMHVQTRAGYAIGMNSKGVSDHGWTLKKPATKRSK